MILNDTQAVEILQSPSNAIHINEVKKDESKLRVFTEEMSKYELNKEIFWVSYLNDLSDRTRKKFERILTFARYSLPIVQITDSVLNDYFKVFDGKNRHFNFTSESNIERLKEWDSETDVVKWIEEQAMEVFKNKPNSFVVVDVDSDMGVPYLILVDSERLVDAKFLDNKGNLEYIAFRHSQMIDEQNPDVVITRYAVYDSETYRVFDKRSDSDVYQKTVEEFHGLGECPGKSFVCTGTNANNPFKRRVAFSSGLSKLEDWTTFDVFRNYMDHYVPFPVTEAPARKCANKNCERGQEKYEVVIDPVNNKKETRWRKCTSCKGELDNGAFIGPGTHIGVKVSSDPNMKDASGVFRMIYPEIGNIKYVPEKLQELELEIKLKTTGINTVMENEAMNKLQVQGSFVSMESVLLRTKKDLDSLYKWIITIAGKIVTPNAILDIEANHGTEWYLVSEEELQNRFQKATEIGLPDEEKLNIYRQIIETKYKGNSSKMDRQLMILDLDPFPLLSTEKCVDLFSRQGIDLFELSFKVNFMRFISKFEFENIEITSFGINLPYSVRIKRITETLYIYNNELLEEKAKRRELTPPPPQVNTLPPDPSQDLSNLNE